MTIEGHDPGDEQQQTLAEAFQYGLSCLSHAEEVLAGEVHLQQTKIAINEVIDAVRSFGGVINALMWNDTNAEATTKQRIALARFVNVYANRERLDADQLQAELFETWLQAVGAMGLKVPKGAEILPVGFRRESIPELAAAVVDRIMGTDDIATIAEAVTTWQTEGTDPVYRQSGKTDPVRSSATNRGDATS